jgi:hypothetical protein
MLAKPTKKVKQKTDFLEPEPEQIKAENFIFDANKRLPVENIILTIQGKKCLSTKNVLVISGKPKSRKSVVAQSLIGSAISGKSVLGFDAKINSQDKVVLIDTEQSQHDLQNSLKRMTGLIDCNSLPNNFLCYTVRQLNPAKIKQVVSEICTNEAVRLIVIDGALDLILNMNDILEVKDVLDFIKSLLNKHNIALVLIVHQAKTTNYTIGHLGSFLDRFAQTVLDVTKLENGMSEIKAQMMRSDADFKPYSFYFNYNINNYSLDWHDNFEAKKTNIKDYTIVEHSKKVEAIFKVITSYTYTDFIKVVSNEYTSSDYLSKQIIKLLFDSELIFKNDAGLIVNTPF